ncbi:hypothetical protein AAFF27_07470 [Xylophilus sp. GW821-FHT01B05]
MPAEYDRVAGYFHKSGAYRRFKDFLHAQGVLEAWYAFEARATEEALRRWCEEQGIQLG